MNFNFTNVEESTQKPKLQPGIYEVEITGVTEGTSKSGQPTIEVGFVTTDGTYEHVEKMSANPVPSAGKEKSAQDVALSKILHIATKLVTREQIDAATTTEALNKLLTGKTLRMKFIGEESEYNGQIYVNTKLGFPTFAETIVKDEPTKLVYNPGNTYDYKKYTKPAMMMPTIPGLPVRNF